MASKETDTMFGGGAYRPDKEPFFKAVQKFLYNSQTGAIMGRTPMSWAKIIGFYIIFYICLASFFMFFMMLLHFTLDPRIPKYKLDSSLIGTNPALGFRPMPNDSNSLSTLIWYKGTNQKDFQYWVESLQEFLDPYRRPGLKPGRGENIYKCDYDTDVPPGKVCEVDMKNWYPCTFENTFNYQFQAPCVFIKLNKIFGWKPEYYDSVDQLPEKMPSDLKNYIRSEAAVNPNRLKTVWVSCEGESPADVENIGRINFLPRRGFPGFFFPYENNEGYLSPIVAVHFERPKTGIVINIECRAWAKNIKHDKKEKIGMVHFELLID